MVLAAATLEHKQWDFLALLSRMIRGPHLQNMMGLQDFCSTCDSQKSSLQVLVLNSLIRPARPEKFPLSSKWKGLQCFSGKIPQESGNLARL